jgi:hypothetical protein
MWENIKHYLQNEQIFIIFLIIIASFGSFTLGRYSVLSNSSKPEPSIIITHGAFSPIHNLNSITSGTVLSTLQAEGVNNKPDLSNASGQYVASKSGKRYHHLSCPGAKQIKEDNKIFFSSTQAAEAAGYTRAANCSR